MVDEAMFTREVEALLPVMYRVSMNILHREGDAQDAMQQALTKAWEKRAGVRPDYFRPWLMRIAVNECHNIHRHRRRVTPVAWAGQWQGVDPPSVEAAVDIQNALHRLPEKVRIPFLLKYLAEYTEAEVAAILKIPKTTVKNRLHKARQELRSYLSDWEVMFK